MSTEKLDLFAIVELFGHTRMAGKVTEQGVGPATFIRVDVPETDNQPSFTRLLNPSAIYAINPVTEEVMMHMAKQIQNRPIEAWDIKKMQEKLLLTVGEAKKKTVDHPFEEEEEEEDDSREY